MNSLESMKEKVQKRFDETLKELQDPWKWTQYLDGYNDALDNVLSMIDDAEKENGNGQRLN